MSFRFIKKLLRSRPAAAPTRPVALGAPAMFDALEERLALYADPFLANLPSTTLMENNLNSVVRLQTNQGMIDIELYDRGGPANGTAAPLSTANFLRYINTGRMDNTFFHRMISSFVLQGGGFQDDPTSSPQYAAVTTDAAVRNEFHISRSNVERTVAMAKLGGDPNSATSQWFFNLADNSGNLNTQNGGFTVFGRVIQGWNVVTTIAGFQTRDLNNFLGGDAFGQVPLSGPNNTDLIRIIDAEVIKPRDQVEFLTNEVFFPDGFRSGRIVSSVEMTNLDPNAISQYEIIGRFETGTRDKVISSGVLQPGQHLEVIVSRGGSPGINNVKGGAPFAYMIRSSKPVSAALNHKDFGASASESFFRAAPFTDTQIQTWTFGGGRKGIGIASYVVWENLSSTANTVTVTFFPEGLPSWSIVKTTQPYRRGGLNIAQLPRVPDGLFSIQISSSAPIVAALSQYRTAPARASLELGVIAGGNTEGILPGAYIASTGQATISGLYTGTTSPLITIDFQFILSDGTILTSTTPFTLGTGVRQRTFNVAQSNVSIPTNQYFTIRYKVRNASAPVTLSYYSVTASGDAVATPFQTVSNKELNFSDGFTDPSTNATDRETLSIFNPFADNATAVTYVVKFHFTDSPGDEIVVPVSGSGSINGSRRIDINTRDLTEVMTRINSGTQFRHYTISISADFSVGGNPADGAIFAQITRLDPTGSAVTSGPTLDGTATLFFADNAAFGAP